MVPGVVIGIATLVALVEVFSFLNPVLGVSMAGRKSAEAWPRLRLDHRRARPVFDGIGDDDRRGAHRQPRPRHGRGSNDLYATPLTTFRQIVLPQIMPSILAGFLLAFTFSFDDFIVAFFVAGSKTTLPIYVFASIRRGVTPEINAVATIGARRLAGPDPRGAAADAREDRQDRQAGGTP